MKVIEESAEHHFLTFLEKVRRDNSGWMALRVALSRRMKHEEIIEKPEHIKGKLHSLTKDSQDALKDLQALLGEIEGVMLYRFADFDVIALIRPTNEAQKTALQKIKQKVAEKYGEAAVKLHNLAKDIYGFQKLADERLLSAGLIESYKDMADANRVHSIPLRRDRREDAVVMIVEDDRFTASYAANILNKEYDVVLAKNGEDAIRLYIEHAPDVVFLDIHLPGLNGQETLRAIRKVDPKACVFMLSVDTVKENIVTANKEGATGFLKKPFSKERLMAAVKKSPHLSKT